jgi:hypothetical protein
VAISCLPHIQRTKKVSKADTQQQPVLALTPQKSKWKFNAGVIEAYQQHCTLAQLKMEVYLDKVGQSIRKVALLICRGTIGVFS